MPWTRVKIEWLQNVVNTQQYTDDDSEDSDSDSEEDESFDIVHASPSSLDSSKSDSSMLDESFLDVSIEKVREYTVAHSMNAVITKRKMKVRISAAIIQVI